MKLKTLPNGDILTLADGMLSLNAMQFPCIDEDVFDWVESKRDYVREMYHWSNTELEKIKARKAGMVEYKALVEQI